jgi:Na+/melibiose symporter-like transporter
VFYFLFYTIGISFTLIPYDALGMELTQDYKERASLFGYKAFGQFFGFLTFGVLSLYLSDQYPDDVPLQLLYASFFFAVMNLVRIFNLGPHVDVLVVVVVVVLPCVVDLVGGGVAAVL